MKKMILMASLIIATGVQLFAQQFKADTKTSKMEWVGKKVTGQHNGEINVKNGELTLKKGNIVKGNFTIDMQSIVTLDLQGEWKEKLEGHLKSADFFDVEKHNTASFTITGSEAKADEKGNTHVIKGNLTIKGITKPLSFPAKVTVKDSKLVAIADIIINRTDYDIKYGSGKFFEGLGDKMIYDDFEIKLNFGAVAAK
ncbi:MAG: YceI family protein [Flavobacteriales bacterium]|nr:YceI family protein [Flavobacteriales bacterium]